MVLPCPHMQRLFPHLRTFAMYLFSGGTAAVFDVGSYLLLLYSGVWFIAANVIAGVIGFFAAFLMHKFVVFQKQDNFLKHLGRFFIVDMSNLAIMTGLLYLLVDMAGIDASIAKFLVLAPMVLWNFFVYKFLVYT